MVSRAMVLSVLVLSAGCGPPECSLGLVRSTLSIEIGEGFFEVGDSEAFTVAISEEGLGAVEFGCPGEHGTPELVGDDNAWDGETGNADLELLATCKERRLVMFASPVEPTIAVEANGRSGGGEYSPSYREVSQSNSGSTEPPECSEGEEPAVTASVEVVPTA